MADEPKLDFPTVQALVRLRYSVEYAVALARDPSEPGAHMAIIALDGAVEYALWLTARSLDVRVKRMADRDELQRSVGAALTEAGKTWAASGLANVEQLHRARNDAQHAAVRFDAGQLPEWSTSIRVFIDSLLRAAFERPLSTVALADAVRDVGLADLLRRAERDIEAPVPEAGAFLLICEALDEARRRWRRQQAHVFGGYLEGGFMDRATLTGLGMLEGVVTQDERLADLVEVLPFVSDLGEYSWLLAARRQHRETRWIPKPDDRRRALIFVAGWIVRWEVFDRGYPQERWQQHFESIAPPTVGDGTSTKLIDVEASMTQEVPGQPMRYQIHFTLANVPDRARGPWGSWLDEELVGAATELGEEIRFEVVRMYLTGQLLVVCQPGADPDALVAVVRRALARTDDRYRERAENPARRRELLDGLQAAFAELVASARQGQELFSLVEVKEREHDRAPVVSIELKLGELSNLERNLCFQAFQGSGLVLASATVVEDHVVFDAFELTTDNEQLLRETIRRCEETVLQRRKLQAQRARDFQEFADRLGELL